MAFLCQFRRLKFGNPEAVESRRQSDADDALRLGQIGFEHYREHAAPQPQRPGLRDSRKPVIEYSFRSQIGTMEQAEFDKFADEYGTLHSQNIRASGEKPAFFAEYKVKDAAALVAATRIGSSLRVLDFGAGVGNSVPFFAKHIASARLTCLDVSVKSLKIAEARFPGRAEFRHFDGRTLPFDDMCFDMVFSACVFHHIPESEHPGLFGEIFRVLTPGGVLLVFEHNPKNPLTVRAVSSCPFDENAVLIGADTMCQRIRDAGFTNIRRRFRVFFPRMLRALRVIEPLIAWLPFGAQYYVVAQR